MPLHSVQELHTVAWQHFDEARPLIPMYIHLLLSALFPIYAGAHASLSRPASAAKPDEKDEEVEDQEEDQEETVQQMEGLSPQDALVFPVTAAAVLAGLYFLVKRFGADMINLILGYYFAGVGIYSVGRLVNDTLVFLLSFIFPTYLVKNRQLFKVSSRERKYVSTSRSDHTSLASASPLVPSSAFVTDRVWALRAFVKQKYAAEGYVKDFLDVKANVTVVNLLSALLGIVSIVYANFSGKPWWLTNLQGFAVCYSAFQLMSPTTFATGSLILSGLFFYDIWAVFFTPLMVTVAKNIDQPIKLVFPRPDQPPEKPGEPPVRSYSMLGLGDIVLPGLMIALALRFDLYLFYLRRQTQPSKVKTRSSTRPEVVKKATYTPVTGAWGNRFWTWTLPSKLRPDNLKSFPKPYFTASMIGYILGMLTTLAVMTVFQHAQPALLYLVPGVLISLWSCAVIRGELKDMWNYTEAINGESLEEDGAPPNEKEEDGEKDDGGRRPGESWTQYIWRSVTGEDTPSPDQKTKEPKATDTTDEAPEKLSKSREGVVFAFSISKLPTGKDSPAKKEEKSDRAAALSQSSESSEDVVVVASATDYKPVTPRRSRRRGKSSYS